MLKNALLVAFAAQLAFASSVNGQTPLPPPTPVIVHDPATSPIENIDVNGLPFVSGHSAVPSTCRSRFESDGDCGQCNCQQQCVCGDKKAQHKAELQYKYWGYPDLFCERPHGSFLRAHLDAQIAKGVEGQMTLYHYDFFEADQPLADALKPAGHRVLSRIIDLASLSPTPIMIEATGNQVRDATRRANVLSALSQMSVPISEDQVITIARDPYGMSAEEAAAIHINMLRPTRAGSSSGSSSQGAGIGVPILPVFGG